MDETDATGVSLEGGAQKRYIQLAEKITLDEDLAGR